MITMTLTRCRGRGTDSPETHPDDRPGDHLRPPSPGLGRAAEANSSPRASHSPSSGDLRPRPFSRCSSSRSATPCSKAATPTGRRRGDRGEARAQARAARPVLQADRGRLLAEPPEPAGELTESLEKETGCG